MNKEACESFIDFCDEMMIVNEGFFDKFKKKKEATSSGNITTPEDKEIISYLNRTYASKIKSIITNEYNQNKVKYNKLGAALVAKAAKKNTNYDGEEVDFDIDIDSSFSKCRKKNHYVLQGDFFQVDQSLGFEIEGDLEKAFFSAIEPKIKQLCGSKFVRIEGDMDDYPGGMAVILKCTSADIN